MRRIIEVTHDQDREILKFVEGGRYGSVQQFLSVAIDNQLLLEAAAPGEVLSSDAGHAGIEPLEPHPSALSQPIRAAQIETVQRLRDEYLNDGEDPTRWLWGQLNSVLAIKFACREIATLLAADPKLPLPEVAKAVAKGAARLGDHLRTDDTRHKRRRGENLATSFPTTEDKSKDRFAYQYAGYRRTDGRYDGALFQLGLLGMADETQPRLTPIGAEFASLPNPVIDGDGGSPGRWLSPEEEDLYLRQVAGRVLAEMNPLKWTIVTVQSGVTNRAAMNERLSAAHPTWSEAEVDTYRVGAVSRLVQLRVLRMIRNGRDIRYELGPNAGLALSILELST